MGDVWGYKLRKLEIAWELASKIIPGKVRQAGKWTEDNFMKHAQETIKTAKEIVDTIFDDDKAK